VLGVAPDSLDGSELLTTRLRAHHDHVCRGLRARGRLACS
jgi:hypothetical protein